MMHLWNVSHQSELLKRPHPTEVCLLTQNSWVVNMELSEMTPASSLSQHSCPYDCYVFSAKQMLAVPVHAASCLSPHLYFIKMWAVRAVPLGTHDYNHHHIHYPFIFRSFLVFFHVEQIQSVIKSCLSTLLCLHGLESDFRRKTEVLEMFPLSNNILAT